MAHAPLEYYSSAYDASDDVQMLTEAPPRQPDATVAHAQQQAITD